ncbi:hypothetical protein CBR65_06820 [Cellvibrio sp. PSBB006]|nr:hypothetical protein CBR65_06820 [Cellvibrio sp. PSBB006]
MILPAEDRRIFRWYPFDLMAPSANIDGTIVIIRRVLQGGRSSMMNGRSTDFPQPDAGGTHNKAIKDE